MLPHYQLKVTFEEKMKSYRRVQPDASTHPDIKLNGYKKKERTSQTEILQCLQMTPVPNCYNCFVTEKT